MDEGGALKRVVGTFMTQVVASDQTQLCVNKREEGVESSFIAATPTNQEVGYLIRRPALQLCPPGRTRGVRVVEA